MDVSLISLNVYLAVIPSILLLIYVYKKDIVEKEPLKLLITLFFLGIFICAPVIYFEQTVIDILGIDKKTYLDFLILAFLIVGLFEEGFKFLIITIATWKNKNFNHKYDSIVYSVFVSLGFATIENILYVVQYNYVVAIYRGIISVPAHAFYAISSGYLLGIAKEKSINGNRKMQILFMFLALIVPIVLHGLFDFLLFLENGILIGVFFSFVACLYFFSYYEIKKTYNVDIFKK